MTLHFVLLLAFSQASCLPARQPLRLASGGRLGRSAAISHALRVSGKRRFETTRAFVVEESVRQSGHSRLRLYLEMAQQVMLD
jgi:hypothetical protein